MIEKVTAQRVHTRHYYVQSEVIFGTINKVWLVYVSLHYGLAARTYSVQVIFVNEPDTTAA